MKTRLPFFTNLKLWVTETCVSGLLLSDPAAIKSISLGAKRSHQLRQRRIGTVRAPTQKQINQSTLPTSIKHLKVPASSTQHRMSASPLCPQNTNVYSLLHANSQSRATRTQPGTSTGLLLSAVRLHATSSVRLPHQVSSVKTLPSLSSNITPFYTEAPQTLHAYTQSANQHMYTLIFFIY
jgi:hypothetical protein